MVVKDTHSPFGERDATVRSFALANASNAANDAEEGWMNALSSSGKETSVIYETRLKNTPQRLTSGEPLPKFRAAWRTDRGELGSEPLNITGYETDTQFKNFVCWRGALADEATGRAISTFMKHQRGRLNK